MNVKNLLTFWRRKPLPVPFQALFRKFKGIIERNNRILELMGDMGDKLGGEYVFDKQYIRDSCEKMEDLVFKLISDLSVLSQRKNVELFRAYERIRLAIHEELSGKLFLEQTDLVLPLNQLDQETVDAAGNKFNTLGILRNLLGLNVPDGFVVTTRAFSEVLGRCGLTASSDAVAKAWKDTDETAFDAACETMRTKVLGCDLPRQLTSKIMAQANAIAAAHRKETGKEPLFAVRSSAWGEGGEISFAGQYSSVLGVRRERLAEACKEVLASAYSPQAWHYRSQLGFREDELAMAVGIQVMVPARVSGTLQTCYGRHAMCDCMAVYSAPGLGAPLMDGAIQADTMILGRTPPFDVLAARKEENEWQLQLDPTGGIVKKTLSFDEKQADSLPPEQAKELARACMAIESYLKRPVEVEWSMDDASKLYILQARPFTPEEPLQNTPFVCVDDKEVVLEGEGFIVQQGVASGKVHILHSDEDLSTVPHGAVLVSRFTSPRYSRIMPRLKGIITDIGSPAGHMATIAREHRLPTVVNTGNATQILHNGDEITLDASNNVIYRGIIPELQRFELENQCVFEESYEYRLLRRLLKRISPLHLVDPKSDDFRPSNCRTFHDITRYIHEKAVEELIQITENRNLGDETKPRRLVLDIPLGLTVIDVEDGLQGAPDKDAHFNDVLSVPLQGLLQGMINSDMWCTNPVAVDMTSFMSSFTRTVPAALSSPVRVGRNLAVVSREYCNLHLRLGYHFNIVDAYLSEQINDNYIYFRFMGGVTGQERRSRRARFIAEILEHYDFRVEIRGDLVVGRIKKLSLERGVERMLLLGGLVGYTRQLDVQMHTAADVEKHVELFLQRIAPVIGSANDHERNKDPHTGAGR